MHESWGLNAFLKVESEELQPIAAGRFKVVVACSKQNPWQAKPSIIYKAVLAGKGEWEKQGSEQQTHRTAENEDQKAIS